MTDKKTPKHFSSWMFYDGPRDHVEESRTSNTTQSYSHTSTLNQDVVHELSTIFPDVSKSQIIEAVRICHGTRFSFYFEHALKYIIISYHITSCNIM
jgi:hypothetical protein